MHDGAAVGMVLWASHHQKLLTFDAIMLLDVSAPISLELQCGIIRVVPNLWYDSFRWFCHLSILQNCICSFRGRGLCFGAHNAFCFSAASSSEIHQLLSADRVLVVWNKEITYTGVMWESLTHMFFYIWKCIKESNREIIIQGIR